MSLSTSNSHGLVVPDELGDLVIAAAVRASVAMRVSNVITTASREYRVPVLSGLPAATFVAEGAELAAGDPEILELEIVPAKAGHVAPLSRELVRDSFRQGAPEIVANAQGFGIARVVDASFFGGSNPIANDGLEVLDDVTEVDAGTFDNLDWAAEAQARSEDVGGIITAFVASPDNALWLAQLKRGDGSNEPLLQPGPADPTAPISRTILGAPLYSTPACASNIIWGISQPHSLVVVREDVETEVSTDVWFTSDRVGVKSTARVGWGWAHPAAIVKITLPGS